MKQSTFTRHLSAAILAFSVGAAAAAQSPAQSSSQPGCFQSIAGAALQSGPADLQGFRLSSVRLDVFSGLTWATVVSCAHPERPGVLVRTRGQSPEPFAEQSMRPAARVLAGADVVLLRVDASSRLQLQGIALASGTPGERVRVRLQAALAGAPERYVTGIVQPDGTLELEN